MDEFEKNEILTQVSSILKFCQEIVSRLSSLPPTPAITEANKELKETIAKFNDEEQEEVHQDEVSDDDHDLWWDSNSPPPQYYTLVFDDDEVSLFSLDESYADFLLPSDMLEDVRLPSDKSRNVRKVPENTLMQSVFRLLSVAAPDAIYRPNWRQEEAQKLIHPVFYNLWSNCDSIFTDEKEDDDIPQMVKPDNIYRTIDLLNVNSRFIENIPKPNSYPVLGVSPDPDFYHKWYSKEDSTKHYRSSFPHGALCGYETNIGIVAPPTEPIHGYIWSDHFRSFVLHAVQPGDISQAHTRRRRG